MYESIDGHERLVVMIKECFCKIGILGIFIASIACLHAADFKLKTADQAAPAEVSEPIKALLSSKSIALANGDKTVLQFWPVKEVLLKSKPSSPASALDSVAEATLLGAVSVQGTGLKDYKDNDISKGVYTARFVLQPQNGDHLGTAEFNYFIALVGAADDKQPATFTSYGPLVKASGKQTSSGHPLVMSLRPVAETPGDNPTLTEPASEHKAIRVKLPGKANGGKVDLSFDWVYEGHGHIQ